MKSKLTLLLLSVAFLCSAQSSLKFITFNLPDVRQLSDSVALNAKEVFKFKSEGVPQDNRIFYVVTYSNVADTNDSIIVMFRIDMIGGTQDYINPGTPQYLFNKITGKFSNLFPFWFKFMKPSADASVILEKKKDEAIVRGATYDFNEESTHWTIEKF